MNTVGGEFKEYFILNEDEIEQKIISQVGVSACGATAALNVLACFDLKVSSEDAVKAVKTRLRKTEAPLPEYLKSRGIAGTTHMDIIDGIDFLTNGIVKGRFFSFYPKRNIDLYKWLVEWLSKGAIPIATLNLQREKPAVGCRIADAWHHQMIYGVTEKGVHLCNPVTMMSYPDIGNVLCSKSILKIRAEDILLRFDPNMDFSALLHTQNHRLETMNVAGQVIDLYNLFCKEKFTTDTCESLMQLLITEFVSIPAAYKSGITLFMKRDSEHYQDLVNADELPI